MSVVTDFIAAEIAKLQKIVPTPVEPFGYGTDLSCVTDITETMDEVDPNSVVGIGEAQLRRLTTPRGSVMVGDPSYGIDVNAYLNRGTSAADINAAQGEIRQECLKDDRISDAAVTVVFASGGLSINIINTPVNPNSKQFTLTFAIPPGGGAAVVKELG